MESMCAAADSIPLKSSSDNRGRPLFTDAIVAHDHDPQWLFPRVLFRGPISRGPRLINQPLTALLQVLIAFFTKILSAVSAQAESEQTGGTKHCVSCSGGRVARNI